MPSSSSRFVLLTSFLAVACADAEPRAGVEVRDSAGVVIVENGHPADLERWSLDTSPFVAIGQVEGDPEYLFGSVAGAVALSSGHTAVLDFATSDVRVFDARGAWVGSFGGEGDGPGELRVVGDLWRRPGDSVVVMHYGGLTLFDPEGSFVRSVNPEATPRGHRVVLAGQTADGTVAAWHGLVAFGADAVGTLVKDTLEFHFFSSDGEYLTHVTRVPAAAVWIAGGIGMQSVPFEAQPTWGVGLEVLHVAGGAVAEVRSWDASGELRRVVRWRGVSRPVTSDMIERYRDEVLIPSLGEAASPAVNRFLAEAPLRDALPMLGSAKMRAAPSGELWVQLYHAPWESSAEWLVISDDGRLVARIDIPTRLRVLEVSGHSILGVWRDELDVEQLRWYRVGRTE